MGKISQHSTQASDLKRDTRKHTRRLLINTKHVCDFLAIYFLPWVGTWTHFWPKSEAFAAFRRKNDKRPEPYRWNWLSHKHFRRYFLARATRNLGSWWRLFLCRIGLIPFCLFALLFFFFSILSAVFSMGLNWAWVNRYTQVRRGGSRIFLGGGALVSCATSTPINHIVFHFLQNTSCIRNPQVISRGGCAPPAPSP